MNHHVITDYTNVNLENVHLKVSPATAGATLHLVYLP